MDVIVAAEKKSSFSLNSIILRLLPASEVVRILVWFALPVFLWMGSVGVGGIYPCAFTKNLPFLIMGIACLTIRYKNRGLFASYSILAVFSWLYFHSLEVDSRLWQMGLLFTIALAGFIFLLSIEEITSILQTAEERIKAGESLNYQLQCDLQLLKKTAKDKEKEFQEELENLKQEAEQRRIEKVQENKRFELIQTEIEWLTSQKDTFIETARNAKSNAAALLTDLQEQEKQFQDQEAKLRQELITAQHTLEATRDEVEKLALQLQEQEKQFKTKEGQYEQEALLLQETLLKLQQPQKPIVVSDLESAEKWKRAAAAAEGSYHQLRIQFEDKKHILAQTRKELFYTQGKLASLENDLRLTHWDPEREEAVSLEKDLEKLSQEVQRLQQEVISLEELVSHVLSQ